MVPTTATRCAPPSRSASTPATASPPASRQPTAPHTARVLADSATEPASCARPGHVFPLRYRAGGVLVRPGHTEAAVDLARLAGLDPGRRAGRDRQRRRHDGPRSPSCASSPTSTICRSSPSTTWSRYRQPHETLVERVAETSAPDRHGDFAAYGYAVDLDGGEHVASSRRRRRRPSRCSSGCTPSA